MGDTTLIDEDFQSPAYGNNTGNPTFTGWTYTGNTNNIRSRNEGSAGDGFPADWDVTTSNQGIQFTWTGETVNYDLSHNWSTTDVFLLKINATGQKWSGLNQRYIRPSIREDGGTVLWDPGQKLGGNHRTGLPLVPSSNPYASPTAWQDTGSEETNFVFLIDASEFTAGTTGSSISLRVGASGSRGLFFDNISLEVLDAMPVDNTAPTPAPTGWESVPVVQNFTEATMTADPVGDDFYGVEYLFENTTTGDTSGWLQVRTWTQTGLAYSTSYDYRYKARDLSPNLNETAWSPTESVTTPAEDLSPPTPEPLTWATTPMSLDYGVVTMTVNPASDPSGVEYYFENTTAGTNSGWQDGTTWVDGPLDNGVTYNFRARARDKAPTQNTQTTWSSVESETTWSAPAGTLVITDFQGPLFNNNQNNVTFPGWDIASGSSEVRALRETQNAVPNDANYDLNQVLYLNNFGSEVQRDIDHNWAADDVFTLTINAAATTWNGNNQRYIRPRLVEQVGGAVLWNSPEDSTTAIPLVGTSGQGPYGNVDWQDTSVLLFEFEINASEFTAGTTGSAIALRLDTSGVTRGVFIDNVRLSVSTGGGGDPESAFDTWATSNGVPTGSEAVDSDSGGQINLYEFGLGGTPTNGNDDGSLLNAYSSDVVVGGDPEGVLTILVRDAAAAGFSPSGNNQVSTADGITYTVSAESTLPVAGGTAVSVSGTTVTDGLPGAPDGYSYVSFYITGAEGYFQVTVESAP